MQKSYKYEELIKRNTKQEYKQEGGEILFDCKHCKKNNKDNKIHVQLETGDYNCDDFLCMQGNIVDYIKIQKQISLEEAYELVKNYDGLYEYSEDIGVPIEVLEKLNINFKDNKVRIPYYDEYNQEIAVRLKEKKNKDSMDYWR